MKSWCSAMTCWSVQVHTNLCFCMINIQGRELGFSDFEENMLKIGLHLDASELISFKFAVMIDMTKLYILIPV